MTKWSFTTKRYLAIYYETHYFNCAIIHFKSTMELLGKSIDEVKFKTRQQLVIEDLRRSN